MNDQGGSDPLNYTTCCGRSCHPSRIKRMEATIETLRQEKQVLKDDLEAAKSLSKFEKVQLQENGSLIECLRAELGELKIAQSAHKEHVDKAVETAVEKEKRRVEEERSQVEQEGLKKVFR